MERILQIIAGAIVAEHLLEGLHKNYWTSKIIDRLRCRLEGSAIHEFLGCKFCQSWYVGWLVALVIILLRGWSLWNCVWMGIVISSVANMIHGLKGWLEVAKYSPFADRIIKRGN